MATETVGRNDPCPCGSGEKYKRCHMGKVLEVQQRKKSVFFLIVIAVALAAGGAVWQLRDFSTGVGVAVGVLVLGSMVVVFRNPPPPKGGSGDPAGMNFGR